jgi:hypothetical protein
MYRIPPNLDARGREFYREALKRFHNNVTWAEFEEFAFGMGSSLYKHRTSHLDVVEDPLYRVLTDMWLDLGVKQGLIAEKKGRHSKSVQRRSQSGGRQATNQRNSPENSKLAPSDSLAGSHS